MPARPYRPSGSSDPGSLPILIAGSIVVGIAVGVVESIVGQWFHLLILFPLLAGLAVGAFAAWLIARRRIRAPLAALVVAGLGGLTTQLAVHVADYVRFRAELEESVQQRGLTVDQALEAATGSPGFTGYMLFVAEQGITIKRAGQSSDGGTKISGVGSFVLWGVEALLALGVAASMARSRALEPFCERCRLWYGADQVVSLGSPDDAHVRSVVAALDVRDLPRAVESLGARTEDAQSTLTMRGCPRCLEHEPVLTYQVVTRLKKKPQARLKYRTLLRPAEAVALREAAAAHPPAAPAAQA
ncbi:MAG TPA: hypothetical protein VIV57_24220 [Anaeromyxobacter sp.]